MCNNIKPNTLIINGQDFKDEEYCIKYFEKKISSLVACKNMMKLYKVSHYYYNPFPFKDSSTQQAGP